MSRSRWAPARTSAATVRCAVYTRKSSEEGLEQEGFLSRRRRPIVDRNGYIYL